MAEVLFFASGLRLPIVMALPNRSLESPVNIWSDHQDSLVVRDSGWIQLYANSVQEVHDMIVQAFKLAENERILLPTMVCYEGFLISHVAEVLEPLPQEKVDAFLPEPDPKWAVFDLDNPFQINELLTPEAFPEYRYKQHTAMKRSIDVYKEIGAEFQEKFSRSYEPVMGYKVDDAEVLIVGLGSIMSTTKYVVNELREKGEKIGLVDIKMFRPFPEKEFREITRDARVLAVMDKDIGFGTSGMVYPDITRTWYNRDGPLTMNFIVGLGGREVVPETIKRIYEIAQKADRKVIEKEGEIYWPDTLTEVIM
jgi:pyruvate ferredoxin oxidoreductase alpha subunit